MLVHTFTKLFFKRWYVSVRVLVRVCGLRSQRGCWIPGTIRQLASYLMKVLGTALGPLEDTSGLHYWLSLHLTAFFSINSI